MKSLDEIMIAHQSDKGSQFSRTWAKPHDYCRHLEQFFAPLRQELIAILEIGVGGGESIKAWLEYFPCALVFGVDINANTNEFNTELARPECAVKDGFCRYRFVQGNQSDTDFWKSVLTKHILGYLDIIVDDGSHLSSDIMITFNSLMPHLKSGGLYSIEDLKQAPEAALWLQDLVGPVNMGTSGIDEIFFSRELCVMRKK